MRIYYMKMIHLEKVKVFDNGFNRWYSSTIIQVTDTHIRKIGMNGLKNKINV